jgi:3-hydroxyacyl-CoA dehydrogenase
MGSRIAAHIANAGVPVVLLDVVPSGAAANDRKTRNAIVTGALQNLSNAKPAAFFDPRLAGLIVTGNLEDDLKLLSGCDWIIEAVAEKLDIKKALLSKILPFWRAGVIVTTNTSGLPVSRIVAEMPPEFRRHWFGTHFFNPPRYMRLVEVIATPESDPEAIEAVLHFCDLRLGKQVVRTKDTPNFIANRIGTFAMLNTMRVMQKMDLTIEQIDALTGSALGWPRTGTFRLGDLVGIDVLVNVARNFLSQVRDERSDVTLPVFVEEMFSRGWLGDKTKGGFYKTERGLDGREVKLGLDWKTVEYRQSERTSFPGVELVKNVDRAEERARLLLEGDPKKDKAAAFYWQILPELWNYAAHRVPEISEDIVGIDEAMRAGFNWELGPFELWDAVGVPVTIERMKSAGMQLAPVLEKLLQSGFTSWYRDDKAARSGRAYFDPDSQSYKPVPQHEGTISVRAVRKLKGVVKSNPGASLLDLGDGIGCIEFHTKLNVIGEDIVSFLQQILAAGNSTANEFEGFVLSGDATNFSAGANLMQLLLASQEGEWDDIDLMVRAFQRMTQAVKFSPRPVVAAPFGLCLGGGAEIVLHSAGVQAHAELYMGLVETGVGLIPAGGGCKEMTLRALETASISTPGAQRESVELLDSMKKTFETIAMAKVSTSASEARQLGLLASKDQVTMNRARLIADAKARVRTLAEAGYAPPQALTAIPVPGENMLATLKMGVHLMVQGQFISEHDAKVGNWLASVLCGGKVSPGTLVTEQYLLDLEREAFLSLCGEKKTQERVAYTLKNGKPLRN